jgi:hypothetical protein
MTKRITIAVGGPGESSYVKVDDETVFEAKPGEGIKKGSFDVARSGRTCGRVPNPHAPHECSEPEKCCNPGPKTKEG